MVADNPPAVAATSTPSDTAFLQPIYFLLLLKNKAAEGAYYYINDHLGAPQIITDDSGSIVWQAEYLPFGKVNISVAQIENNLRFPGQYFDAETGLHYNWNRYYDPETGRYIAADPIGLDGGINLYAYVGSDPVNGVDSMGLYPGDEFDAIMDTFGEGGKGQADTYYGGEGHFILGGGAVALNCTDECGNNKTIRFWKVCFGGAMGVAGGAGVVKGTNGESCRAESYKGWFYEAGASYGYGSAGVDVGYNNDGPFGLPGSLSGVVEGGIGGGLGAKIKSSWCYYIPME
ncbi:RHS repeat-associated core domain-containing protein [Candidatus Electrothrix sp.]|uniref:RHS repeat-associated core domain-containing protein n=2 Tax=Candidatus Electrothrix sp. TaxID=2170559 RepID=UPI004057526C